MSSTFWKPAGTRTRNSFTGALAMSYFTSVRPLTSVSVRVMVFMISARTQGSTASVVTLSFQPGAAAGAAAMNL